MKNTIYLLVFTSCLLLSAQQTNTFPASGKVGVGTTNPISTLHLYSNNGGNVYNTFFDTNSINFETPTNGASYINKKDGGSIRFRMGASYNTIMTMNNNGNIGIGTTTPAYKLEVNGTGRYTGNLLIGDPNGARTEINTSTNHKVYAPTNKKTIDLDGNYQGGGYVGVYNKTNGAVGAQMAVNDDDKQNYINVKRYTEDGSHENGLQLTSILLSGDSEPITGLHMPISNSVIVIGSWIGYEKNKGYGLINKFKTKLENDLYVETGNVGIGTTTPDSKLTVAGNIHAQEIKVTVNAGADFVFNEDYNLPKLQEVEQFIKENKHLPEIASEKEMKDDGLLLAEMDIKLLQKIEELTLYTINQEKKIKSQESQLKTQDVINKELKERLLKLEQLLLKNN